MQMNCLLTFPRYSHVIKQCSLARSTKAFCRHRKKRFMKSLFLHLFESNSTRLCLLLDKFTVVSDLPEYFGNVSCSLHLLNQHNTNDSGVMSTPVFPLTKDCSLF